MSSKSVLSFWQRLILVLLRFSIGWHLFYQGFGKFYAMNWTSKGYLEAATGPFAFSFHAIAKNSTMLVLADVMTVWGLMILGIFLMIGLLSRISALGAFLLLMLFYLAAPPLGYEGFIMMTVEGTELYVNKTFTEALALLVIFAFPTGRIMGLDILVRHWRST